MLRPLLVVDFALALFVAGLDLAAFWDNGDGGNADHADQMLLDTAAGYRMNPMHIGLGLLFTAANATMLPLQTSDPRLYGLAARADSGRLRVLLLNKRPALATLSLSLPASLAPLTRGTSMVDTSDHWGAAVHTPVQCEDGRCLASLPALSFTMLESESQEK